MPIYGLPRTDEQLFGLVNVVLPAWLLLAAAPAWRHTKTISAAAALLMCSLYAALLVTMMAVRPEGGGLDVRDFFSHEGVFRTFSKKAAVLICWVHYAAFDLWVGRWMAADSVERGVPQLLLIPCLLIALFVGPAGLLAYWLVRTPFLKAGKQKAA
ncbi:hypothetical protein GPECTOR_7g1271 [Gonium pectorale]|uniref:DUF4281 domain-containing protein n=1 Tax=Gonium pectorale TaxID=33097 RepID=A0A150GU38_GONPE|nr:hypothetical protein GPECTOR_7g1271 [Gonium pectorale]|eukprot:KXZ53375.1 hypothetical protein GPECTOR_7g1271 [Gonium pectorale]